MSFGEVSKRDDNLSEFSGTGADKEGMKAFYTPDFRTSSLSLNTNS